MKTLKLANSNFKEQKEKLDKIDKRIEVTELIYDSFSDSFDQSDPVMKQG